MEPTTSISPDWRRAGVSPPHGPASFDDPNRSGASIAELTVSATTGPTPGIVIMIRQAASCFARSRRRRSRPASSARSASRARSIASAIISSMAFPSASSHTRAA